MDPKVNNFLIPDDVSRETKKYYDLLMIWNKSLSLMENLSYEDFYKRHVLDALDLAKYLDLTKVVYDLGSGAGVPGIILSIMGFNVEMVESNLKKTTFLNHVIKTLSLPTTIHHARIESININPDAILTARALASLKDLLGWFVSRETVGIFLKGKLVHEEIEEAKNFWDFKYELYKRDCSDGYIIKVFDRV